MSVKTPIYLDYHATTPADPRVVEAMLPYFTERFGNAASRHHQFGWTAEAAVEKARGEIARLIGAEPTEIVFTSGATESINLALKGIAEAYAAHGDHIVTVGTEHKAGLDTCARLEKYGFTVTRLPVDRNGMIDVEEVAAAITPKTILVSVMTANNEIGTIAPVAGIGHLCRERGILFHSDAAQAAGKISLDVESMNADMLSLSAHKMYGPKGVGALYVRASSPRIRLTPQHDGGGHERGLRSGTVNVPGIVGFGAAAEIASREMTAEAVRVSGLRDRLQRMLIAEIDDVLVNGHPTDRLPNNLNMTFRGVKADRLMMDMKDIAVSSGSACSSSAPEPSHVLQAIGMTREDVLASLRFGLGRFTTDEEIDYTIGRVVEAVKTARAASGRYHAAHV